MVEMARDGDGGWETFETWWVDGVGGVIKLRGCHSRDHADLRPLHLVPESARTQRKMIWVTLSCKL